MGKAIGGLSGSSPLSEGESSEQQVDEPMPSIGTYLARQRRLRGIELEELAAVTKIPRRSLERLESGAFDGVTDGFVRGFVRTVADAIGLDPDDTVTRMLAEPVVGPSRAWPPLLQPLTVGAVVLAAAPVGRLVGEPGGFRARRRARNAGGAPAAERRGLRPSRMRYGSWLANEDSWAAPGFCRRRSRRA